MKVENYSGREYYLQRSKDNFMAKWCSTVTPSRIDLDGTTVEAFGDVEKSNYIYLVFEGTTYCLWAKDPRNFEFLEETSLRITDRGRPRSGTKKASIDQPPRVVGRSPKIQMGKEDEPPTREDLEVVLLHLPRLREQVESRMGDPDAAEGLYSEAFSSAVRKVVKALFQHRFMFPFNYQPWMDEARKLEENPELLANADLETLRKLVVVHWRQDYWDYDHTHWESMAATGHLVKLLERLEEIAQTMEPTVNEGSPSSVQQPSDLHFSEQRPESDETGDIGDDANSFMTLSQVAAVADWHTTLRDAVRQERQNRKDETYDPRSRMLEGTVKKMLAQFEAMNVFVEFDIGTIGTYGYHYAAHPDDLTEADLMTLRKLLSYYLVKSGQTIGGPGFFDEHNGYWSDLALNGPLLRILRIFGHIHQDVSATTLVR